MRKLSFCFRISWVGFFLIFMLVDSKATAQSLVKTNSKPGIKKTSISKPKAIEKGSKYRVLKDGSIRTFIFFNPLFAHLHFLMPDIKSVDSSQVSLIEDGKVDVFQPKSIVAKNDMA